MNIKELQEAYYAAEQAIKEVEKQVGAAPVPSLNEIRYAGNHIISYLAESAPESASRKEDFLAAIKHCRRAYYDAQSTRLLLLYEKIENRREVMRGYLHFFREAVGEARYYSIKEKADKALAFIEELGEVRQDAKRWEKREELSSECQPHIDACKAYLEAFEHHEEEICSRIDQEKKKQADAEEEKKQLVQQLELLNQQLNIAKEAQLTAEKGQKKSERYMIVSIVIAVLCLFVSICSGIIAYKSMPVSPTPTASK